MIDVHFFFLFFFFCISSAVFAGWLQIRSSRVRADNFMRPTENLRVQRRSREVRRAFLLLKHLQGLTAKKILYQCCGL